MAKGLAELNLASKIINLGLSNSYEKKIRNAFALSNLLMLVEMAARLAIRLGLTVIQTGQRLRLDWHGERGLSLLQLGIREIKSRCHNALPLPVLTPFPWCQIPPACASLQKRATLERQIEFSKVVSFSF